MSVDRFVKFYVPFWPRTSGTPVSFAFGRDVFHAARVKLYASVVSEKGYASVRTARKTDIVTARKAKYGRNVMSSETAHRVLRLAWRME